MDDLELALDDCLQQLASGKSSLGQCLARYPRYANELRPLLETALRLQQGKAIRPSGSMRDRARAELADYIKSHPRRKARVLPKLATGMIVIALAAMLVGTAFAQNALPGQHLYAWKLSTELAWRATSSDPISADLTLANRRTMELITLAADAGAQPQDAALEANAQSEGIAAYTDVLDRLATETAGPSADRIYSALQDHQTALSKAGIHVPELDDLVSHDEKSHNDKGQGHGQGNGQGNGQGSNP